MRKRAFLLLGFLLLVSRPVSAELIVYNGTIQKIAEYSLRGSGQESFFGTPIDVTSNGNLYWFTIQYNVSPEIYRHYYFNGSAIVKLYEGSQADVVRPKYSIEKRGNGFATQEYVTECQGCNAIASNIYYFDGINLNKVIEETQLNPTQITLRDFNNGFIAFSYENSTSIIIYLYKPNPTLVTLSELKATPSNKKINLNWKTESEIDNAGFNVWRTEGFKKITPEMLPAQGTPTEGAEYDYLDLDVFNLKPYFYLLEDIDNNGISTFHGPVKAVPRAVYGIYEKQ